MELCRAVRHQFDRNAGSGRHFGHLGTACLNAANGQTAWATQAFAYSPVHGNGSSPVLIEDLLIFSADAETEPKVIALDKTSGQQRWAFARQSDAKKKFSFCTPLIIDVNGQKQLITPGSGVVNALNPKTGEEIPITARRVVTFRPGQKLKARVEEYSERVAAETERKNS